MTWSAPKTNWASDDAIGTTDLNRIEDNTSWLRANISGSIAYTGNLPITIANSVFIVTGNGIVDRIESSGRSIGEIIHIRAVGSLYFSPGSAASGSMAGIETYTGLDVAGYPGVWSFLWDGTVWVYMAGY